MSFFRDARPAWMPLVAVIVVTVVLFVLGYRDAAALVGPFGTWLALLFTTAYIVLHDSRKRWPGTSWIVRLGKLFSFQR